MNRSLFLLLGLSMGLAGQAQEHECGSTLQSAYERYEDQPEVLKAFKADNEAFNQHLRNKRTASFSNARLAADSLDKIVRYIPVVFHILHDERNYNLSVAQIESQIEVLNEDFRRQNATAANTPEPFKYTADSTSLTFAFDDVNDLAGVEKYILLQAGPTDAEDFEFNIPSGDKFVIYFTNDDFGTVPLVEPTNGESISFAEVEIDGLTTQEEVRDAVKTAIDNNFGGNVTTSIDTSTTDPSLVVVNSNNGHAVSEMSNIPAVNIAMFEREPGRYVAADARIEFRLARLDPNGNPTTGINRVYSDRSTMRSASEEPGAVSYNTWRNNMKSVKQWDPSKYFNIWSVDVIPATGGSTILGFAQFPGQLAMSPETDGVVLGDEYLGNQGSAITLGRTLTHEAGHWLNLRHIWGDDDTRADGTQIFDADYDEDTEYSIISAGSDDVFDTPNQGNRTNNNCPTFVEEGELGTLHGDMFMNYMDYATDACMSLFTFGQVERMRAAMDIYRANIWSEENLVATGVSESFDAGSLKPAVDYMVDRRFICAGGDIEFTNVSTNTTSSSTYTWSFPGSNVASVSTKSPTVEFTEPGTYTVQLDVTNANGTTTKVSEDLIHVFSSDAELVAPLYANFTHYASIAGPNNIVSALSEDGVDGWSYTQIGSPADGEIGGLRVASYLNDEADVQSLVFKTLNTEALTSGATFSFDYAYVKKQPDTDDRFILSYRTTCTGAWKVLYQNSTNPCIGNEVEAEGMTTNGGQIQYVDFYPEDNEWKTVGVDLPPSFRDKEEVYIRIEYFGRHGNYFYFDNVNISNAPLGQEEIVFENSIGVYPNPNNGNAVVQFNLDNASNVSVEIVDIIGKTYGSLSNGFGEGENKVQIEAIAGQLSNGVYFAKITKNNRVYTQKFLVSK